MSKELYLLKFKIPIDSPSNITDYQYNHNGTQIAATDSDGVVYIYHKVGQAFMKQTQFKAEDAAIWSISWGPSAYGRILAIGSFKKKVAIYQQRNNEWIQVSYHFLHDGSVNKVAWAPADYGLKLFAAGSDGKVSILELSGNSWNTKIFTAHDLAINTMDILPSPLNEENQNNQFNYPVIATGGKDHLIKIWVHGSSSQQSKNKITPLFTQSSGYTNVIKFSPHKQMIRSIMFRNRWSQSDNDIQLISCSQDGSAKLTTYKETEIISQQTILDQQYPVNRISQNITGNIFLMSVGNGTDSEQTYCIKEKNGSFDLVKKWEAF